MKRMSCLKILGAADYFAALCAAFALSQISFASGGSFTDLTLVRQSSVLPSILITVLSFAAITAFSLLLKTKKIIAWSLMVTFFAFSAVLVCQHPGDIFFNIGIGAVLVIAVKYVTDEDRAGLSAVKIGRKASFMITAGMFLVYAAVIFLCTAAKYKTYSHATYDFGIFAQMFEQMAKTGLPVTTVERAGEVSHFAVHFSPVFYILLPGYYIFRSPLYLLLAQAVITGLGAFPVRRICRTLGLSEKASLLAAAVYLLYPTISNGTFYDFHENKFLTVLLLYVVWFVLENNRVGTAVFCLLTLSVKEDAFIYVLAIALWMLVTGRDRAFAAVIAVFSIGCFFFACAMIRLCGGEIMSGRFANLSASKNGGLFDAVKTCFIDAGYLIKEIFSGADTEAYREITYPGQKLEFVLWTGAPLLFLPFAHRKCSNLVLMIPLLIINLVPSWMYQYNVDYQYTYGTAALMIFSALLCISRLSPETRRFALLSSLVLCAVFTLSLTLPKAERYVSRYAARREIYEQTDMALKTVPEDASVTAYGFMMPHLWYMDDLHTCPDYYGDFGKTDYCIIDVRYESDEHTEKLYRDMGDDYELVTERGYAKIYRLKGNAH